MIRVSFLFPQSTATRDSRGILFIKIEALKVNDSNAFATLGKVYHNRSGADVAVVLLFGARLSHPITKI